jgi:hypothetical protein
LLTGQVNGQTSRFLRIHKGDVTEIQLRNLNRQQTGERRVFPLQSGIAVSDPATKQVARPTTIFRESDIIQTIEGPRKSKYECEYDDYGHVTSLKYYDRNADPFNPDGWNYVLQYSVVIEYHRLPNGEFVRTKEEFAGNYYNYYNDSKYRRIFAYDDKGMQLWYQFETWDHEKSSWHLDSRMEAVVNDNGVRTAIRRYQLDTEQMETDHSYTFDDKGRITRYEYEWAGEKSSMIYIWDDNDRITKVVDSWTEDGVKREVAYENIQIVWNDQYFNPYSLAPLSSDDADYDAGNFADDYTLHQIFYNADANITIDGDVLHAQIRTTVNDDHTQIAIIYTVDSEIVQSIFLYILDENGSYRIEENYDGEKYKREVTYNSYGELTWEYDQDLWIDGEGEERQYENENVYDREYDDQGRQVKTVCSSRFGNSPLLKEYEDTYTAWTSVTIPSESEKIPDVIISVYPNPATDRVVIDNAPVGAVVTILDMSGRELRRRTLAGNRETVSIATLPQGLYLFIIQTDTRKIINKIIKK